MGEDINTNIIYSTNNLNPKTLGVMHNSYVSSSYFHMM